MEALANADGTTRAINMTQVGWISSFINSWRAFVKLAQITTKTEP